MNKKGETALIKAAKQGHHKNVLQLIKANAKLKVMDKTGQTALMHAVRNRREQCVKILTRHEREKRRDRRVERDREGETEREMERRRQRQRRKEGKSDVNSVNKMCSGISWATVL